MSAQFSPNLLKILENGIYLRDLVKNLLENPEHWKNMPLIIRNSNNPQDDKKFVNTFYVDDKIYYLNAEQVLFLQNKIQNVPINLSQEIIGKTLNKQNNLIIPNLEIALEKAISSEMSEIKQKIQDYPDLLDIIPDTNKKSKKKNTITSTANIFFSITNILGTKLVTSILLKVIHQTMILDILNDKYAMKEDLSKLEYNSDIQITAYAPLALSIGRNLMMITLENLPQLIVLEYPGGDYKGPPPVEAVIHAFYYLHQTLLDIKGTKDLTEYFLKRYDIICDYETAKWIRLMLYKNLDHLCEKFLTAHEYEVLKNGNAIKEIQMIFNNYAINKKGLPKLITVKYAGLGGSFIEIFKKHKIVTENIIQRTTYISLNEIYDISVLSAASTFKPTLGPLVEEEDAYNTFKNKNTGKIKYQIKVVPDDKWTHPGYNYTINLKKDTKKLLEYNNVKYCVNDDFLGIFLHYFQYIINIDPADTNAYSDVREFFQCLYEIDLDKVLALSSMEDLIHREFIKDIREFGTDFTNIFNKRLKMKYKKLINGPRKQKKEKLENPSGVDADEKEKINFKTYMKNVNLNLEYNVNAQQEDLKKETIILRYKLYKKYLDKITHYKFFLVGLLNELVLYNHFNHFHLPKFISYTGRVGTKTYFTNLQAYKHVKAFIGIRRSRNNLTTEDFDIYKEIIANHIQDKQIRNKIKETTYEQYTEKTETLLINYLESNFKALNGIPFKLYDQLGKIPGKFHSYAGVSLKDFKEMLKVFLPSIKKPRLLWQSISQLLTILFPNSNIDIIASLDASTNGLQIISMMLNDEALGKKSNLIGTHYFDIYKDYLTQFNTFLVDLNNQTKQYIKSLGLRFSESHGEILPYVTTIENNVFEENQKNTILIKDHLLTSKNIAMDMKSDIYKYNISDSTYSVLGSFISSRSEFRLVEPNDTRTRLDHLKEFLDDQRIANIVLTLSAILVKNRWILEHFNDREMVKKLVMASAYGLTVIGGIKALKNFFIEKATENSIVLNELDIYVLSKLVEAYYSRSYRVRELPQIREFLELGKLAKRGVKSYSLSTDYLTWECQPFETEVTSVNIKDLKGSRKKQLNVVSSTGITNGKKLSRILSAIIVHSADANIMHRLMFIVDKIDVQLNLRLNREITLTPNHDSYGFDTLNILFGKELVNDQFNQFNQSNYYKSVTEGYKLYTHEDLTKIKAILKERMEKRMKSFIKKTNKSIKYLEEQLNIELKACESEEEKEFIKGFYKKESNNLQKRIEVRRRKLDNDIHEYLEKLSVTLVFFDRNSSSTSLGPRIHNPWFVKF